MRLNVGKTTFKVGKRLAISEEMYEIVAVEKDKCYWVYKPSEYTKMKYLFDRYIRVKKDRRLKLRS